MTDINHSLVKYW